MEKITFCIPSKNNLRYLKNSIASIQKNSVHQNDIIVYVDASTDGTIEWLNENNIEHIINDSDTPKGIAYGYNRCIEAAKTEIVCMFHADMFMGKDFDRNIIKHLKPKTVIAGTRIEPPLHPEGKEKIVKNFGMYPEDFTEDAFNEFVKQEQQDSKDQVTYGIFAPWACYKSELLDIGIHDESFHSYHEDSDIFNRFLLAGMKCIQSRDALVYHLTCRGGQFQDGIEQVTKDESFHQMKQNSARHYIRKWGSWIKNDEYQHPIIIPKYNIAFVVEYCTLQAIESLEPWCDRLYIKGSLDAIAHLQADYINKEAEHTSFNLLNRVLSDMHNDAGGENDIVVRIDCRTFDGDDFMYIQHLAEIIKDSGSPEATFELGHLQITINSIEELQNNLINV